MNQQSLLKKASSGLAGALAIAGGTSAYGTPTASTPPADFNVAPGTANTVVNWDVNNDGIMDFTFQYRYPNTATGSGVVWQANMNPFAGTAATNGIVSYAGAFVRYAFALGMGVNVGPTNPNFSTATQVTLGSRYLSAGTPSNYGGFAADGRTPGTIANGAVAPSTNAYVGFRFSAADGTHFGWLRLNVNAGVIDFSNAGYESVAGTAIATGNPVPEPSTMAMLALGAAGVLGTVIKRRRA